jgi:hypothetical protein
MAWWDQLRPINKWADRVGLTLLGIVLGFLANWSISAVQVHIANKLADSAKAQADAAVTQARAAEANAEVARQTIALAAQTAERDARKAFLTRKQEVYAELLNYAAEMIKNARKNNKDFNPLENEDKRRLEPLIFAKLPSVYDGRDRETLRRSVFLFEATIYDPAGHCHEEIQPAVQYMAQCVELSLADAFEFTLKEPHCTETDYQKLLRVSTCKVDASDDLDKELAKAQ